MSGSPLLLAGIIAVIAVMWSVIAFHWWKAMDASRLDGDFMGPAIIASFTAFLFTGPFCMVVWFTLLLRAISLNGRHPNV